MIGAELVPPPLPVASDGELHAALSPSSALPRTDVLRRIPINQAAYDGWRQLWSELAADPDIDLQAFAEQHASRYGRPSGSAASDPPDC
ncbi:hypothetical protein [Dactylosporangium sp. CA-139066]|uniref:hypothetical protein n=1 Tax=Dactylosporangium sp. CA-139066 TaxID=3239930 RepID=UPI003D8EE00A